MPEQWRYRLTDCSRSLYDRRHNWLRCLNYSHDCVCDDLRCGREALRGFHKWVTRLQTGGKFVAMVQRLHHISVFLQSEQVQSRFEKYQMQSLLNCRPYRWMIALNATNALTNTANWGYAPPIAMWNATIAFRLLLRWRMPNDWLLLLQWLVQVNQITVLHFQYGTYRCNNRAYTLQRIWAIPAPFSKSHCGIIARIAAARASNVAGLTSKRGLNLGKRCQTSSDSF